MTTPLYSQEVINIGTNPNDGTGDPLRVAFDKINNNFTALFQTYTNSTISATTGNTQGQVIFETPANTFTQGQFFIKTIHDGTANSQFIQLSAQINNDLDDVKFTGYGSTFFGNPTTSYDMAVDIVSGNVQILVNPLASANLTHYVASSVMYGGANL